ncbi:MAG: leucine-rich repeat domain-containing protein [Eubacterium sp.]|nr:leucine-rich repeat domain-containing protein [Eubacterium sp.]
MKLKRILSTIIMTAVCISTTGMHTTSDVYSKTGISEIDKGIFCKVEKDASGTYHTTIYGKGAVTSRVNVYGNLIVDEGITELHESSIRVSDDTKSIKLPQTLEKIGDGVFFGAEGLQEIEIPVKVKYMGKGVFNGCQNLKRIVNHSSVEFDVPQEEEYKYVGYDFEIDGKPTTKVGAGKTAIGVPKSFKLKLVSNGGKIVGKKVKSFMYLDNIVLPKAKKKGFDFIGWETQARYATGIAKLWRKHDRVPCFDQKRYAQFAKVKYKLKKKGLEVKSTNFNANQLVVAVSSQKNRKDEKSYVINTHDGKVFLLKWSKGDKFDEKKLTGKYKTVRKNSKKSWIKVTIPRIKAGKKYYIRVKYQRDASNEYDTVINSSQWFGKRTIK